MRKKIALLHRYPESRIAETNAAFPYLRAKGMDVLTFKQFDRLSASRKFFKSLLWIIYAPLLVWGRGYDIIYCDDSYPFYPALVKLVSPRSRVVIRIGDFHLMYYTSGLLYAFLHLFEKLAWCVVDSRIAISHEMANHMKSEILKPVAVVPDPVDITQFAYLGQENHGSVMFHGVLTKNKRVDLLIDAARLMPDITFIVIGTGPDRPRLERLAPANVIFKGWVDHKTIPYLISTCAVGVALRSDNPGNQFVVTSPFLQYGAMGRPCLVTRRRVYRNYDWQFTGLQDMVDKLRALLACPEEGLKLRDYIIEHHDAERVAEALWSHL